jgi:hypothetical protein
MQAWMGHGLHGRGWLLVNSVVHVKPLQVVAGGCWSSLEAIGKLEIHK